MKTFMIGFLLLGSLPTLAADQTVKLVQISSQFADACITHDDTAIERIDTVDVQKRIKYDTQAVMKFLVDNGVDGKDVDICASLLDEIYKLATVVSMKSSGRPHYGFETHITLVSNFGVGIQNGKELVIQLSGFTVE